MEEFELHVKFQRPIDGADYDYFIDALIDFIESRGMMIVEVLIHPRYKLADLMAEMPEGLPRVEGWDEMPSVGLESC